MPGLTGRGLMTLFQKLFKNMSDNEKTQWYTPRKKWTKDINIVRTATAVSGQIRDFANPNSQFLPKTQLTSISDQSDLSEKFQKLCFWLKL